MQADSVHPSLSLFIYFTSKLFCQYDGKSGRGGAVLCTQTLAGVEKSFPLIPTVSSDTTLGSFIVLFTSRISSIMELSETYSGFPGKHWPEEEFAKTDFYALRLSNAMRAPLFGASRQHDNISPHTWFPGCLQNGISKTTYSPVGVFVLFLIIAVKLHFLVRRGKGAHFGGPSSKHPLASYFHLFFGV